MSSAILKTKDIENVKHVIVNELEETIKFLNRCAGFSPRDKKEENKFNEYNKIAQGKGKSLAEIKRGIDTQLT